jgi:hypothetical protein
MSEMKSSIFIKKINHFQKNPKDKKDDGTEQNINEDEAL